MGHCSSGNSFNSDDAGGLASIGRFSSKLGYLIGLLGLALSVRVIDQNVITLSGMDDYAAILGLFLYLILSPLLFFLPLQSARSAMVASRDRLLKDFSQETDAKIQELRTARSENADKTEPLLKKLRQLDETRTLVKRFPVWPLNMRSVRKFFGLVLTPITPAILDIIIDLLTETF